MAILCQLIDALPTVKWKQSLTKRFANIRSSVDEKWKEQRANDDNSNLAISHRVTPKHNQTLCLFSCKVSHATTFDYFTASRIEEDDENDTKVRN